VTLTLAMALYQDTFNSDRTVEVWENVYLKLTLGSVVKVSNNSFYE